MFLLLYGVLLSIHVLQLNPHNVFWDISDVCKSKTKTKTAPRLLSPVERFAARGRSAAKCTGWRTATCGAPPAAGKKPVRDSPTDGGLQLSSRAFGRREGGHHFCMLLIFVCPPPVLIPLLTPLKRSSPGCKWRRSELCITVRDLKFCLKPHPPFPVQGTPPPPVQLNRVKRRD